MEEPLNQHPYGNEPADDEGADVKQVDMPRFDWTKDILPSRGHNAVGRCSCGGEYDQSLLLRTGNSVCSSCGQCITLPDPSFARPISVEFREYVRRARRNLILIAIFQNFSFALIAIYFINSLNANKWLVWASMIAIALATRRASWWFARVLSRPK